MRVLLTIFTIGLVVWLAGVALSDPAVTLVGALMAFLMLGVAVWSWLHGAAGEETKR